MIPGKLYKTTMPLTLYGTQKESFVASCYSVEPGDVVMFVGFKAGIPGTLHQFLLPSGILAEARFGGLVHRYFEDTVSS